MRISDWSSDVCSSDLAAFFGKIRVLGECSTAGRVDLLGHTLGADDVDIRQHDHSACFRQRPHACFADIGARPGDDLDLACHMTHYSSASFHPCYDDVSLPLRIPMVSSHHTCSAIDSKPKVTLDQNSGLLTTH